MVIFDGIVTFLNLYQTGLWSPGASFFPIATINLLSLKRISDSNKKPFKNFLSKLLGKNIAKILVVWCIWFVRTEIINCILKTYSSKLRIWNIEYYVLLKQTYMYFFLILKSIAQFSWGKRAIIWDWKCSDIYFCFWFYVAYK